MEIRVGPVERSSPLRRRAPSPRDDRPVFGNPVNDNLPDGHLPQGRARALDLVPETSVSHWLAQMRLNLQGEINSLAKHRHDPPGDFEVRMKRLSLAMYLLERMNFLMRAADGNLGSLGVFDPAVAKVQELLDDSYFRKEWGDIITGFVNAEAALRACSSFCPFALLDFNEAVDRYRSYVDSRLEKITLNRQAPGVHIAIIG